jgi:hypothetical protein
MCNSRFMLGCIPHTGIIAPVADINLTWMGRAPFKLALRVVAALDKLSSI